MPYLFHLEKCILLFLNNVRLVPLTSFNIAMITQQWIIHGIPFKVAISYLCLALAQVHL